MTKKRNGRPTVFNQNNDSGVIQLTFSESDVLNIVSHLEYAYKMYKMTERVFKEQEDHEKAMTAQRNANTVLILIQRIIIDSDPNMPDTDTPIM